MPAVCHGFQVSKKKARVEALLSGFERDDFGNAIALNRSLATVKLSVINSPRSLNCLFPIPRACVGRPRMSMHWGSDGYRDCPSEYQIMEQRRRRGRQVMLFTFSLVIVIGVVMLTL